MEFPTPHVQDDDLEPSKLAMQVIDKGADDHEIVDEYWFCAEINRAVRELRPTKNSLILDLGSGTGTVAAELIRQGNSVVVVDYSIEALRILRRKCAGKAQILCADIRFLPLRRSSFDRVISLGVLQHLSRVSVIDAAKEISRILKPKGMLVLTVYNLGIRQRIMKFIREGHFVSGHTIKVPYYLEKDKEKIPIPLFLFDFLELRRILGSGGLKVDNLVGIEILPRFSIKRLSLWMLLERVLSGLQVSVHVSQLLLAVCTKVNSMDTSKRKNLMRISQEARAILMP